MTKRKSRLTEFEKMLLCLPPFEFQKLARLSQKFPDLLLVMGENFKEKLNLETGSSVAVQAIVEKERLIVQGILHDENA